MHIGIKRSFINYHNNYWNIQQTSLLLAESFEAESFDDVIDVWSVRLLTGSQWTSRHNLNSVLCLTGSQFSIVSSSSYLMFMLLLNFDSYGSSSMTSYKKNLQLFCASLKRLMKEKTLLIWTTTLPVAQFIRGGFLIDQVSFLNDVLRLDLLMANFYAHQVS